MYILGVNISHDPSACLLKDGEIVYYCEDERLTGKKDPVGSNVEILGHYEETGKILPICSHVDAIKKYTSWIDYVIFTSYGRDTEEDDTIISQSVIRGLQKGGINFNTSMFYADNHHIYHAANAFFASGFDDAAALVLDGGGAYDTEYRKEETYKHSKYPFREIESIFDCSYDNLFSTKFKHCSMLDEDEDEYPNDGRKIFWKRSRNEIYSRTKSCGDLFNIMCDVFDLNGANEAGKLMGLSGHRLASNSHKQNYHILRNYEKENQIFILEWFYKKDDVWLTVENIISVINDFIETNDIDTEFKLPNLDTYICASLAHKLQEETYKHTCRLIQKALDLTGKDKIVLSGGYFLNCVNNYKYARTFPNVEFFIDPMPHDAGTAIGAAKYLWYGISKSKEKYPFEHIYFGPST